MENTRTTGVGSLAMGDLTGNVTGADKHQDEIVEVVLKYHSGSWVMDLKGFSDGEWTTTRSRIIEPSDELKELQRQFGGKGFLLGTYRGLPS